MFTRKMVEILREGIAPRQGCLMLCAQDVDSVLTE